jgi:hypothetical protein
MSYIRTDAPPPPPPRKGKAPAKFVFDKLEVGHSFFVGDVANIPAGEKAEDCSSQATVATQVSRRNRDGSGRVFRYARYAEDRRWWQIYREA